ncbi:MAG: hypothetical protein JW809_10780 [Pirellulales bacterium]|nr:hypothetical protein [Pirellulales bacterium]
MAALFMVQGSVHKVRAGWLGRVAVAVAVVLVAVGGAGASDWMIETVDNSGNVGFDIDIAVRDPGYVHVWYDSQYPVLDTYALRDDWGWTYTDLEHFGACDLEVDLAGQPRLMSTQRPGSYHMTTYWQYDGSQYWWTADVAPGATISAGNAQLDIDSQGDARVAYIDRGASSLVLGRIQGDLWGYPTWQGEIVATDPFFDTAQPIITMALDRNDQPCFLWRDYSGSEDLLRYAHRDAEGSPWQVTTLRGGTMFSGRGMAFDSDNNLHVAFTRYGTSDWEVCYGTYDGATWQEECVDPTGNEVGALVIDSLGQPHIGYIDFAGGTDAMKYATLLGSHWHTETIAEMASSGNGLEELAMTVDSADHLHMVFRGDADALQYARLDVPPRPQPHETRTVPARADAEAIPVGSGLYIMNDGSETISIQRIPAADIDRRALLEFDVGLLSPSVEILSASLVLDVAYFGHSATEWPTPSVYAFEGTGDFWPDDLMVANVFAGTSQPVIQNGAHSISLAPEVLDALLRQSRYLGFLIVGTNAQVGISTLENPFGDEALLVLELTLPVAPGDANRDGQVNGADAAALAAHWLSDESVGWADGDFNRDGAVDDLDLAILAANWQGSTGGPTVPEPAGAVLLAAAALALGVWRRGRRV